MIPELKSGQRVFIEISNSVHGGSGWEFGTCLWSPVTDRGGNKAWKIMEEVRPGDLVIHLMDQREGYVWAGMSLVVSELSQVSEQPPDARDYENMAPYQRLNLD